MVHILSPEDATRAATHRDTVDYLVVDALDWKVIPLENLIAGLRGSRTRLLAIARTPEEAALFLEALEVGVDGLLFLARTPGDIPRLRAAVDSATEPVSLVEAEVEELRPVGTGDRVCVDTCTAMGFGEGMLVGNQSGGLFLVHAESVESGFVAPRPFRVNAGPVHAYVLVPGGRTRYLSELAAGDEVLVVSREGRTRRAVVGRVKIERRPLLLLRARLNGSAYSALLQNAETIRLVRGGEPVSVSALRPGDRVLLRVEDGGRHFGMRVDETVTER